jgi:hypothetical protein
MPRGPRGEKRPADVIGVAAAALGRKGGKARAERMTAEQRSKSARKAARSRWAKKLDRVE